MPQITVQGVPEETTKKTLRKLRKDLIAAVEAKMGVKKGITRIFFPSDMLGDPNKGQDDLIWAFLYTGMFKGKPAKLVKRTTKAIAETIRAAFGGKFDVEVYVMDCDPETKTLLRSEDINPIVHGVEHPNTHGVLAAHEMLAPEEGGEQWYLYIGIEWNEGRSNRDGIVIPVPKPQKGDNHYELVIESDWKPEAANIGVTLQGDDTVHWAAAG